MLVYLGFDDTDDKDSPMGTGRLVREFTYGLADEYKTIGIVRHQLPRLDDIPFTSNNSSACAIIELPDSSSLDSLRESATSYLVEKCAPGSDPGLCIALSSEVPTELIEYSQRVTGLRVTQKDAMKATESMELYGLGGTNDGIIGAAAAVGLTKHGWCGRFIEYGKLRDLPAEPHVHDLISAGIQVISVDRDPLVPLASDLVCNATWIRPSLWAGTPMLQVKMISYGVWEPAHGKRKTGHSLKPVQKHPTIPYNA